MPNPVVHFAIEADDVERAKTFYQSVFEWHFEPWGPPGFYLIEEAGIHGALQARSGPSTPGAKGFECTIAVADLAAVARAIEAAGGRLLSEAITIPTVGTLHQFADTEGNQAVVMQYEAAQAARLGIDGSD
ncbi:MAG: VOC family protein [Pseudomonadota bacterium]